MTKTALTPEVISPLAAVTSEVLTALGEHVRAEFSEFNKLNIEARWRALRLGLMLNQAKELSRHGEFLPWLNHYVPQYGLRQSRYVMSFASEVVRIQKLAPPSVQLLLLPDPHANKKGAAVVNSVAEFFGDRSLTDLFDDLDIKPRKPKGGARIGAGRPRKIDVGDDGQAAMVLEFWNTIMGQLHVVGIEDAPEGQDAKNYQTWRHLPKHTRKKLSGMLVDLNHLVKQTL